MKLGIVFTFFTCTCELQWVRLSPSLWLNTPRFFQSTMVYSNYKKQRILYYHSLGMRAPSIAERLREKRLPCTRVGIAKFLRRFTESGSLSRWAGSGRPSKVTAEIREIVEEQMQRDDETTAHQLRCLLRQRGHNISIRTILRCRTSLGWTFRGSVYCQLIREEKRLEWAHDNLGDDFTDVIFTDECTVKSETHRRFCCRKHGQTPKPKPK